MASGLVVPGKSHVKGPTDVPLLTSTIYSQFCEQARQRETQTALVVHDHGLRITFAQLLERVDRAALGLHRLGLGKGDRLGVWLPNCSEWLEMQLSTAKLGAILVNINPDYRLPELEYALNLVACKILVMIAKSSTSNYAEMIQALCPELQQGISPLSCARVPSLKYMLMTGGDVIAGVVGYDTLYQDGPVLPELAESCEEPVNIQFTSGTTGKPKASTLTHKGILNNAYFLGLTMHYTAQDVVCVPVPLYHCFGCVMGNLAMLHLAVVWCILQHGSMRFRP
eukprot:gb/GFBE01017462.1/.p1 GENE.gb/GFBE01017462.1/~~gb/GFBE01017462.1/.p1  ORF type:complete len:282 (+),score=49.24 gb/GFBE01017462.1/:1-846(+)